MIQILDDPKTIKKLQTEFIRNLTRQFREAVNCYIGYRGGTERAKLHYSSQLDAWLTTKDDLDSRYWNGFGIGQPEEETLDQLTTEINFPKNGLDRRIGGAFGKDENGNILVLHRGKIGGGRAGIGKTLFRDKYRGAFVTVMDGEITSELALIGELKSAKLARQVANFVNEVRRIKDDTPKTSSPTTTSPTTTDHNFSNEFAGTKTYTKPEIIQAQCNHGIVVNALADELDKRNFKIGNDRNRDLYITTNSGKIKTIFEVKTDTLNGSLYSAIGQLILYSIGLGNETKLFLVLPDQLKTTIENKVNSIGLDILYYDWQYDQPTFKDLDKKIRK